MKTIDKRMIWILDVLVCVLALIADRVTKGIVNKNMAVGDSVNVIKGVFQFYHVENTGASWGIFKGGAVFFIILAVVVCLGIAVLITKIPGKTKYIRLHIALSFIVAGAVGNVIDRLQKGSVTDFLYAQFIDFPVFNVADIYIVCATIWVIIMTLFIFKDEELDFLNFGKKKSKSSGKKED